MKALQLSLQFALGDARAGTKTQAKNAALDAALDAAVDAASEITKHRAALPRHLVAKWIRHALQDDAEITVRIVDEAEGQALNRDYRKKNYATNVLTFDYARPPAAPLVQADLVLCAPVVAREAREQKKTLQAHYAHLLVHGTLHAQGWDHETSEADARVMESLEAQILARFGLENPYR